MRTTARVLCTLAIATAIAASTATIATASTTDLLAGHGNFEKPVISGTAETLYLNEHFDGWVVARGKVSLIRKDPGFVTPPQGNQALALVDAHDPAAANSPGTVCRATTAIAGHSYKVTFLATVILRHRAHVVVLLGNSETAVALPTGSKPAVWKSYRVTLPAQANRPPFCLEAALVGSSAFPAVDAVKVVDLGK
jgi:hypothetical protein